MSQTKLTDSCDHCVYSELSPDVYPCSKCSSQRNHYTPDPICQSCPHAGTPLLQQPCADCSHNGLSAGIQRNKEAEYQRFVEEMNARPSPCICGENPEYVEDTIYPGEVHRYVVCDGCKPVPHSLSVHGGDSREETIGRWNAFIFNLKNNK